MHKLSLFSLAFLCVFPATAQKAAFGLKAGLNVYTQKSDAFGEFSPCYRTGFHGGVSYREAFSKHLGFQMEMLYSSEGVNLKKDERWISVCYAYLTYPLLLQWRGARGFFLETGPQLSFLFSAKETENGLSPYSLTAITRSYAMAWVTGAGFLAGAVGLGLRYNAGLTRLTRLESDGNVRSNGLQVSLLWQPIKLNRPFRGILNRKENE